LQLNERIAYSKKVIADLTSSLDDCLRDYETSNLCVYATGSFGRLEASLHSDLDLFLFHNGVHDGTRISNIQIVLIKAAIITSCKTLGLPDFDADGQFLDVHYLDNVLTHLGGPEDDYKNYFTARMLMLLEGRCLYNHSVFDSVLNAIILEYCRDQHDHKAVFKPIMLVNDIVRFWKTLCLNYEHKRNKEYKKNAEPPKFKVKNLKLKFSRLLICYPTIASLAATKQPITPDFLYQHLRLTPMERIDDAGSNILELEASIKILKEKYEWFMSISKSRQEMEDWISNDANWEEARSHANDFAIAFYDIVSMSAGRAAWLRYIAL